MSTLELKEILPFGIGALSVAGGILLVMLLSFLRHRERMALIKQGIHPDQPGLTKPADPKNGKKVVPAKDQAWNDFSPPKSTVA